MGKKARLKKERKENKDSKPQASFEDMTPLHGVIKEVDYELIGHVNKGTISCLTDLWKDNAENNFTSGLWDKHANVNDPSFVGMAKNKCVIGVGAGTSFNLNSDLLRRTLNLDGRRDWPDRRYVTIASNHQYKPLLDMGIIPDFVLVVDGSDVVYDQLCTDIPSIGQNTLFLAGIHCSHKVIKEWSEQGRGIVFYVNISKELEKIFRKGVKGDPKQYRVEMGGNVLNGAWGISITRMASTVFIGVGNDLSFKYDDENVDNQRNSYYADGDYSSNAVGTGTGRDEAGKKNAKKWGGFTLKPKLIFDTSKQGDRYNVDLDIVGTTHTLWVYKTWLESTLMRQIDNPHPVSFRYFNCSEAGILGVMSKGSKDEELRDVSNWFLLDEKCKFYGTYMLKDAIELFDKAKEMFECNKRLSATPLVAPPVNDLVVQH